MTEIENSKLLTAIIILLIILILVIIISVLYDKYNIHIKEPFANYQDVKTKTINWCKQMLGVGLLSPAQYDQCRASFLDSTSESLPADNKDTSTDLGRNYSLYNTTSITDDNQLSSSISEGNTNNVMLATQTDSDGSYLYMGCKSDNTIYFIKNINDSSVNQQELYFNLVPQQSSDVYAIMSYYKRYLIVNNNPNDVPTNTNIANLASDNEIINTEWTASFTGTAIGPMSSWKVSKINEKVSFESMMFAGYHMSFNDKNNLLKMISGTDDLAMWIMIPEEKTDSNNKYGLYTGADLIVGVENILQKIKNNNAQIICNNEFINGLNNLNNIINNNYTNIEKHIDDKLKSPVVTGLSAQDILRVTNKIKNMKSEYINKITNDISTITTNLEKFKKINVDDEYDTYTANLESMLDSVAINIENNNNIMARQQDNYIKINKDYVDINKKTQKFKQIDKTSNLNIDLISNYSKNNTLYTKIYPFIIGILAIFLLYLSYLTIIEFKENIYHKY